jgi:trans-aconitate methyltransferase
MERMSSGSGKNDDSLSSVEAPDSSGWSASQYNKTASFVYSAPFVAPVLDLLKAKPGERIIDFGCGSGEVTLQIAEAVGKDGLAVGVDLSESMVSRGRFPYDQSESERFAEDRQSKDQWSPPCIYL